MERLQPNCIPLHACKEPGLYVVVLEVEGPDGKDRLSKIWDVAVR